MVSVLPPSKGFGQRHFTFTKPTPYLKGLVPSEEISDLSRSPVSLQLIREDILKFRNNTKRPQDLDLDLAIAMAYHAFKLPNRVKLMHLNDVFKADLNIWSSSPGLPWTNYGIKTKGELRTHEHIQSIRWFWHRIKLGDKIHPPDSCAFVRAHIVTPGEHKVRAVWGYPATITLGEAVFAQPLIQAYKHHKTPIAYGYDTAVGGCKKIYHEISEHEFGTALDFKSFDKTVPAWLIKVAFKILSVNLDFVHYEGYGVANCSRSYRMYDYIMNYFINTTIRLCDGSRFRKHSGVASGSYFTQLIDSVVNYILLVWAFIKQHGRAPGYIKVFGDDSIAGSGEWFDLELADELFSTIGMKINIKKSLVCRNKNHLSFLGFKINTGYPTKESCEWFAALMFPERPDESWDDVATRALGLLHACAGLDYKFDIVCRAIITLRPFELRWSKSMMKMLAIMGIEWTKITAKLPTHLDLALRVKYF